VKKLLWVILGAAVGIVATRSFAATPQGRDFALTLDARAKEFGGAVAESYRSRQAELRAAIGSADDSSI